MIAVPDRDYSIGAGQKNAPPSAGLPGRKVRLPPYELDVTEVTVADYSGCPLDHAERTVTATNRGFWARK